jgi:hypothetical protein
MSHLTPDELVDAVDGSLSGASRRHVDVCPACRRDVEDAAGILGLARAVELPEPSPLFWQHLSTRVREALSVEPAPRRDWLGVFRPGSAMRWWALAPATALAGLVLALVWSMPQPTRGGHAGAGVTAAGETSVAADEAWALLASLVDSIDADAMREAGVTPTLGSAERLALSLTTSEQAELVRLLQEELGRSGG